MTRSRKRTPSGPLISPLVSPCLFAARDRERSTIRVCPCCSRLPSVAASVTSSWLASEEAAASKARSETTATRLLSESGHES